jgi:hypothetical protein
MTMVLLPVLTSARSGNTSTFIRLNRRISGTVPQNTATPRIRNNGQGMEVDHPKIR